MVQLIRIGRKRNEKCAHCKELVDTRRFDYCPHCGWVLQARIDDLAAEREFSEFMAENGFAE